MCVLNILKGYSNGKSLEQLKWSTIMFRNSVIYSVAKPMILSIIFSYVLSVSKNFSSPSDSFAITFSSRIYLIYQLFSFSVAWLLSSKSSFNFTIFLGFFYWVSLFFCSSTLLSFVFMACHRCWPLVMITFRLCHTRTWLVHAPHQVSE